jgi:hypothetical protein
MDAGHGALTLQLRLIAAFALAGALVAGAAAATGDRDYRARAYVIKVPPQSGGAAGLARARDEAGRSTRVQLTGRGDFAITARAGSPAEAMAVATAAAKAIKRSLPSQPGLYTRGRGAHRADRGLGPAGWALFGAGGGLWLGIAAAIVRRGSGRAPRRALPPCPPGRPATRG